MGLSTFTLALALLGPGQADPDVMHSREFSIPFSIPDSERAEVAQLVLFVSRGQGQPWTRAAVFGPNQRGIPFAAPDDGVFWFQVQTIDRQGRALPADLYAEPPALQVLIDTQKPGLGLRATRQRDEIAVAWEARERYPDWKTFRLEYAAATPDGVLSWQPVAVQPTPAGQARFRAPGAGPVRVRVSLSDTAGNAGEATREVPGLGGSGAALASAVAPIAPIASDAPVVESLDGPLATPVPPASDLILPPPPPLDTTPRVAAVPPPLNPAPAAPVATVASRQTARADVPIGASNLVPPAPPTPPSGFEVAAAVPVAEPVPPAPIGESVPGSVPVPASNLPPPVPIKVVRFDMDYSVESRGPSGVGRAELWVTRDDGKTWVRWAVDDDKESPIHVDLDTKSNPQIEGIYGFKIVLHSGAGLSKGPPTAGDAPDLRADVDVTPPLVRIYAPVPDAAQRDVLTLRWDAADRNFGADPITLEWAESPEGPWRSVPAPALAVTERTALGASLDGTPPRRVANTGSYPWRLPANLSTHRVYLRVAARDAAGNVAEARTPQPIEVDLQKPVARIQGIAGVTAGRR